MSIRMRRNKHVEQKKPRTKLSDMIACPLCHAYSYPRVFSNPETEEQKEALYCGACHVDLTPLLKAINRKKEEERKAKEAQEAVPAEVIQTEETI